MMNIYVKPSKMSVYSISKFEFFSDTIHKYLINLKICLALTINIFNNLLIL